MCNDLFVFIIIYLFSLVDPAVKKFTRVIQGETRVITEVQPSIKKVTRVIDGQPVVKKVTRVIERDPVVTTVTRLVTGKYNMFIDGTMATDV